MTTRSYQTRLDLPSSREMMDGYITPAASRNNNNDNGNMTNESKSLECVDGISENYRNLAAAAAAVVGQQNSLHYVTSRV